LVWVSTWTLLSSSLELEVLDRLSSPSQGLTHTMLEVVGISFASVEVFETEGRC
jgi:hypothetical protein